MPKPPFYLLNLSSPLSLFPRTAPFLSNLARNPFKVLYSSPQTASRAEAAAFLSRYLPQNPEIPSTSVFFPHDPLIPLMAAQNPPPRPDQPSFLLICGDEEKIAKQVLALDFPLNYLTMGEYCRLFPQLVPISKRTRLEIESTRAEILKRLPFLREKASFSYPFQVKAVFLLENVADWEEYGQVITDLLSSEDGVIARRLPEAAPERHIPIYFSSSEMFVIAENGRKSLGLGGLREALGTCYSLIYKKTLVCNENEAKNCPEELLLRFIGTN